MTSSSKLKKHPAAGIERGLRFPWKGVSAALEETKMASSFRTLYGHDTGKGLWLVGDEGVYLMSNGAIDKPTIVYANECDPTKLPFDTWWEAKRLTFGGDDGVEFISLDEIEALLARSPKPSARPHTLIIGIMPHTFTLSLAWATKRSN